MKKVKLSWGDVASLVRTLADEIKKELDYDEENPDQANISIYPIPRGGYPVALMLIDLFDDFVFASDPEAADIIVDDLIDTGRTAEAYMAKYGMKVAVLIDKHNSQYKDTWIVFPWEVGHEQQGPADAVIRLLEYIGEDPQREGLQETPARVLKSYQEIYGGYNQNIEELFKTFTDGACDEMVVMRDIPFYSVCEHHMQPFFGKAHVAYLPDGKVVGASKLVRVVEAFARRLQIQERLTTQVTEALNTYLAPKGAACVIEATHFCMVCRGVRSHGTTMITNSLTGAFRDGPTRSEFLNLIGKRT